MATRVLLLCGGQSDEHEVSLASARSVIAAASSSFEIIPRVVDKAGHLLSASHSQHALAEEQTALSTDKHSLAQLEADFDIVFPLLHGPLGEDGSVQGLLKLMGLPFVGSDVLGSAVGMDKIMMKAVFAAYNLPQVPYITVNRFEWQQQAEDILNKVIHHFSYPLFVKPANLGSSLGISKANDRASLAKALDEAAHYDRRIIVEQGLQGARELEVAILGNDQPKASPVGEISFQSDFYDYATKYTEGRATLIIPADIPQSISQKLQSLALTAFQAVDAAGLARVDFFYTPDGQLYLNEINTMPGFTTTSMYPKLWEAAGLSYAQLIDKLIKLGLERNSRLPL